MNKPLSKPASVAVPQSAVRGQPTVVRYGAWLQRVEAYLEELAGGCSLEAHKASELLAELRATLGADDRRVPSRTQPSKEP